MLLQLDNNYEEDVYNGDLGVVVDLGSGSSSSSVTTVRVNHPCAPIQI